MNKRREISRLSLRILRLQALFVRYLQRYLTEKQFVTVSGALVGMSAAIAAITLKAMVYYIHVALFPSSGQSVNPLIYSAMPLLGIIITAWLTKRYFDGNLSAGNAQIKFSIQRKKSRLPRKWMYAHVLTSAITVGTGGSTGLETPIVATGAAIGSNYGRTYRVGTAERTILLASGVAGGIAAMFNAPIAGVLFAVEVLLGELSLVAFIPLLISAASGAILSNIVLQEGILLNFHDIAKFDPHNVPFYLLLGLLAGVVSAYYIKTSRILETLLQRVKKQFIIPKAIVGGLLLALLIWLFPPLFGEGYESIKILANDDARLLFKDSFLFSNIQNNLTLLILLTIVGLLKVIATSITLGSGGNGGNFAPSLFTGAYLGFIFSGFLNLTGFFETPTANFTVVAMAGVLSGVFYAPLTAIFLIAEITGGYDLITPLMIVSALSFGMSRYLLGYSLDGWKLAKMLNLKDKPSEISNTQA